MEKVIRTLGELNAEATRFAGSLAPLKRATLVTLSGELGAGKTTFVQAVAKALGVGSIVTSPTFVLEKVYQLPFDSAQGENAVAFSRLIHIDAYRLEKGDDLAPLHFDELMRDSENLILLEWPERVAGALPAPAVEISLTVQLDDSRILAYGG